MEIVIEYVLIDNIVINYLILFLACKILKEHIVFWKILISAMIGAGFALIMPIMAVSALFLIILKISLGILMVLIVFPCSSFKKALSSFLTFILMTAVMGGICFAIIYAVSGSLSMDLLSMYSAPIPVGVILLCCAFMAWLINSLIKLFYKKQKENNFKFEAVLINKEKQIRANAFLDTGNTLIDPASNKPVIIITYSLFHKLCEMPLERVLMKKVTDEDIKGSHYISFDTVGKKSEMLVFEIDKINIITEDKQIKTFEKVLLGLSFGGIFKTFSCDALLHPDYVYC